MQKPGRPPSVTACRAETAGWPLPNSCARSAGEERLHLLAQRVHPPLGDGGGQRQRLQRGDIGVQLARHVVGEGGGETQRLGRRGVARGEVLKIVGSQRDGEQRQHAERDQQIEARQQRTAERQTQRPCGPCGQGHALLPFGIDSRADTTLTKTVPRHSPPPAVIVMTHCLSA
jgi:hypothetical protein